MRHPNDKPSPTLLVDQIEAARQEASRLAAQSPTTPATPAFELPQNQAFPGYEIAREIHRGGQAVIYQAVQKNTGRKVAVKVMHEGPLADSRERARFEREVRILGQLRHPNIVTIHESGNVGGWSYFVMDYIPGQPLDQYMASAERSIEQALRLFAKICRAVHAAHLRGVIHRDLKPGNIRVDPEGEPHVLDFGLAKVAIGEVTGEPQPQPQIMTISGQFVGTLPWASPEQAEGSSGRIDLRSDVYSLGVILYQMLTGGFPYVVVGNMREVLNNILNAQPTKPSSLRRQIRGEAETIVLKCLNKEPQRRYQSAGELAEDIERHLNGRPIMARRDSVWYVVHKAALRHRWQIAAVVSLATVLGTAAGLWAQTYQAARRQEREHVASLINAPWDADTVEPEVAPLYEDFFTRLRAGRSGSEERDLLFSNLVHFELAAREICGLDHDFRADLRMNVRADLSGSGFWASVHTTFLMDDREVGSRAMDLDVGGRGFTACSGTGQVRLVDKVPGLAPPVMVELRAVSRISIYRTEDFPGDAPVADLPDPIWSGADTRTQRILILPALPAAYPFAVTDPDVAQKVEAGLHAKKLWVQAGGVGLAYSYRGPLDIAATLQVLDPKDGEVVGEANMLLHPNPEAGNYTILRAREWRGDFLARVQNGELTSARIRLLPDRQTAIDQPDLDAYYGLPIERAVPVDDFANKNFANKNRADRQDE